MRDAIVAEARKWMGVRWKHQGRDIDGIDCAGLVVNVAKALGLSDFDTRDYLRLAKDEEMLDRCHQHLVRVDTPQPGDVGVLKYDGTRHMVIFTPYTGAIGIIHAYSRAPRRVVEHRFDQAWLRSEQATWLASFRFKGIE